MYKEYTHKPTNPQTHKPTNPQTHIPTYQHTNRMEELFVVVRDSTLRNKKFVKEFDGKAFWQPIKKETDQYDNKIVLWKPISKNSQYQFQSMIEYTINGYGEQKIIDKNHFSIQQVRIPLKEPATIKKILQVALNVGQAIACDAEYYAVELSDFITQETIDELNSILSSDKIKQIKKLLIL